MRPLHVSFARYNKAKSFWFHSLVLVYQCINVENHTSKSNSTLGTFYAYDPIKVHFFPFVFSFSFSEKKQLYDWFIRTKFQAHWDPGFAIFLLEQLFPSLHLGKKHHFCNKLKHSSRKNKFLQLSKNWSNLLLPDWSRAFGCFFGATDGEEKIKIAVANFFSGT